MKTLIVVLLVLTVLLLTPLGVDGGYNGKTLILGIRIGLFNIRAFPKKKKRAKPQKPRKKKLTKHPEEISKAEKKAKKPFDIKTLKSLLKPVLKALGRFRKKLRLNYLRIHYTFATDDPFKTAMGFGASSAVMGSILSLVENAFDIGERDIGTSFDFLSDKPVFDFWITTTIQVWEILYIAIAFGIDYLKLKLKQKTEDRKGKE
ncbi:MAG: hypothetical protein KBI01_01275 [Oscillospiraceae bacterium]|nr:hypothetical protein [Oscillospiraceae bacterium]